MKKVNRFIPALLVSIVSLSASHKCAAQAVTAEASEDLNAGGIINYQYFIHGGTANALNFSGSDQSASDDNSTAFGSLSCSFSMGVGNICTVMGTGIIIYEPGESFNPPIPTQESTAVSICAYQLTANEAVNYTLVAQAVSDVVETGIAFNGTTMLTGNGSLKMTGAFTNGAVFMISGSGGTTTSVGGSAGFEFTLQLTPATVKPRFTQSQKDAYYKEWVWLSAVGLAEDLAAETVKAKDPRLAAALREAASQFESSAYKCRQLFLDPVDTNYTTPVQVSFPAIAPLVVSNGITQAEAAAFNAWQTNLSQEVGYSTAVLTAVDRAQGAAFYTNSYWDMKQMTSAVQFEAQLAATADQEPALRSNVVAQFLADDYPAFTTTVSQAAAFQMEVLTNGLPPDLLQALTNVGLDGDSITNIENDIVLANPTNIAGTFPTSLVDTNVDAAQTALAGNLRDSSLTLINATVLPGGQFRFDLPTEPGYTYTIQFTRTLANPASWITVSSTNATTSLLSFTNASPPGAKAGFYRATHN